ncbi:MAG: hypothetical protein D6790_07025 [Caldilineae bacterium]|nr:MAG: hypothetical protein D6790_07025 [Caldilineae bacterium]
MIHKIPSPKPGHVRVIFELPACLWADRVFLVGDFNDWDTAVTPFVQGRDGVWRAILDLPCGREFQFRYLVDGRWQTDYHADGWVENEFGSQNSIVNTSLPAEEVVEITPTSLLHEGAAERKGVQPSSPEPPLASLAVLSALERRKQTKLAG